LIENESLIEDFKDLSTFNDLNIRRRIFGNANMLLFLKNQKFKTKMRFASDSRYI